VGNALRLTADSALYGRKKKFRSLPCKQRSVTNKLHLDGSLTKSIAKRLRKQHNAYLLKAYK
jgi:hypothetical protein